MPAAFVLQDVLTVLRHNPGVVARRAAVADDQVILGMPADAKRQRLELEACAVSAGVHHEERCRMRQPGGRLRSHQPRAFEPGRAAPRLRACATSSTRSIWQCEQYPPTSVRARRIWNPKWLSIC